LNPTDIQFGNSPYSSVSAFAMNPLLISLESLEKQGLLKKRDMIPVSKSIPNRIDYTAVYEAREYTLKRAFTYFKAMKNLHGEFDSFCESHRHWLDEFALFSAIRRDMQGRPWRRWPAGLRDRHEKGLEQARTRLYESIKYEKFLQYTCFKQWSSLKAYCKDREVSIIGDMPLYVNLESADVWAAPHLFKLDGDKNPLSVSGVPPDFFSETGQLWNNPIFNWTCLKEENFSWWVERISHNLQLYDSVRIDHFRGIAGFWEVPFGAETAAAGEWKTGPGEEFLQVMADHFPTLPFIAEDLGVITEDVKILLERFRLPGMRVFQFGFGENFNEHHRPHRYVENCVAYSGTHDNDTLKGWLFNPSGGELSKGADVRRRRGQVAKYLHHGKGGRKRLRFAVLQSIYQSRAGWVVIPVQDILGLGSEARINRPGTASGNWEWRTEKGLLTERAAEELRSLSLESGRVMK
jgi:4-alpha-glucanotransferase